VASEIVKHGGVVLCANIAPYEADRIYNRRLVGDGYMEIWVRTPLEVCESRDVKGLYAQARQGKLKNFTGIDDPFEEPQEVDLVVDGSQPLQDILESLKRFLQGKGYLSDS
jgi:sulfate adenylyltransferase